MTDLSASTSHIECRPNGNPSANQFSTFLAGLITKMKTSLAQRRQRKIDRDAFRNLLLLDEASLKDIGVSKDDIIWASNLAMNENASKELEKVRANNIATARTRSTRTIVRRKL